MKTFSVEIPLRWADMDAMGHLNNVMYFRLFEEARIRWFDTLGLAVLPSGEAPILAHISCDFVRAMTYPGSALVRQQITRLGTSSLDMDLFIERTDAPGEITAKGRSVIVWYDYEGGRSVPWPSAIRDQVS
jgi:acyl-CoA thioester hydrolase